MINLPETFPHSLFNIVMVERTDCSTGSTGLYL